MDDAGVITGEMRAELERLVAERVSTLPASGDVDPVEFDRLQRRLTKLTEALVGREREIESLRRVLAADSGLASEYDDVQGLDPDADHFSQRRDLMEQIFISNLKLKESLTLNRSPAE
ncbi:MAG: hypothetical protein GY711_00950 [bacterium]|nr:hypothetical protein [bacterium]